MSIFRRLFGEPRTFDFDGLIKWAKNKKRGQVEIIVNVKRDRDRGVYYGSISGQIANHSFKLSDLYQSKGGYFAYKIEAERALFGVAVKLARELMDLGFEIITINGKSPKAIENRVASFDAEFRRRMH